MPVLDKSAREALQTFSSGKGDVLLGYENEAILAQQQGEEVDYVIPDETLLIENPIAVVNESKDPQLAQSFVDFLYTPEAQEIFASKGYRPVVEGTAGADEFPTPANLFEIGRQVDARIVQQDRAATRAAETTVEVVDQARHVLSATLAPHGGVGPVLCRRIAAGIADGVRLRRRHRYRRGGM